MSVADRREEIANFVIEKGEARIDELVAAFGVSRMTIHRHVEELARQGVLRKLHGAVSAQPSGVYESLFRFRQTRAALAKQALAQAAITQATPGEVVLIDNSTTANFLAPMLAKVTPLTIITNSLALASQLTDAPEITLVSLGGEYHPTYNAFIGHVCERALAGLRVNTLFCSASAVSGTTALIQDAQVVRIKQAMMAAATRKILLVDSTKFGKVALHLFADLTAFDLVLTDDGLAPQTVAALRQAGVKLEVVSLV